MILFSFHTITNERLKLSEIIQKYSIEERNQNGRAYTYDK